MTRQRPWLSGIRLLLVIVLFAVSGGTALAFQGELKELPKDDETDSEQPGLVEEGEYASPQFDVEITWSDAWAVGDVADENVEHAIGGNYEGSVASDPDLGDIVFLVDTASETSVLSLGFSPTEGGVDPELIEGGMGQPGFLEDNLFLSSEAEILLLDSNRTTAAILAREVAPNDDHVVYMELVADSRGADYDFWVGLDMYEPDQYANVLTSIEDDIEVEDNVIFDVFGADEIIEALESGEPVETEEATEEPVETEVATEAATEEPVETEEPTEEATEVPAETAEATATATEEGIIPPFEQTKTPEATEVASPETKPTATNEASPQASPSATDDLPGLNAEGDYLSPQHEVPVTWNDTWALDPNTSPPSQSFTETGVDSLFLADTGSQGAIVYITIESSADPFDPDAVLAAVSEPDYIENVLQLDPGSEILLSEIGDDAFAVMYLDSSGETPFVSILEARVIDEDTIIFVELRANASAIDAELLDSAEDDIEIAGDDALDLLSAVDILNALP